MTKIGVGQAQQQVSKFTALMQIQSVEILKDKKYSTFLRKKIPIL